MTDADIRPSSSAAPELIVGGSLIGVPVLLTAVRCILQYILLPFVLPLFGLGGAFSAQVNIGASLLGLGVIAYNLLRLWHSDWRTRYLLLSIVIVPFILLSLYFDLRAFQGL